MNASNKIKKMIPGFKSQSKDESEKNEFIEIQEKKDSPDRYIFLDEKWYIETYQDLKLAGVDANEHYSEYGAFEGRSPCEISSFSRVELLYDLLRSPNPSPIVSSFFGEWLWLNGRVEEALEVLSGHEMTVRGAYVKLSILLEMDIDLAIGWLDLYLNSGGSLASIFLPVKDVIIDICCRLHSQNKINQCEFIISSIFQDSEERTRFLKTISILSKFQESRKLYLCDAEATSVIYKGAISSKDYFVQMACLLRSYCFNSIGTKDFSYHWVEAVCQLLNGASDSKALSVLRLSIAASKDLDVQGSALRKLRAELIKVATDAFKSGRPESNELLATLDIFDGSGTPGDVEYVLLQIVKAKRELEPGIEKRIVSLCKTAILPVLKTLNIETRNDLARNIVELAYIYSTTNRAEIALDLYKIGLRCGYVDQGGLVHYVADLENFVIKKAVDDGDLHRGMEIATQSAFIDKSALKQLKIRSAAELAGVNLSYIPLKSARKIAEFPIKFFKKKFELTADRGSLDAPEIYVAKINNCIGFSKCNIIITDDYAIYDLPRNLKDIPIILGDHNVLVGVHGEDILAKLPIPEVNLPTGLALFGVHTHNYGHWFVEFLYRMISFEEAECPKHLPLYVDKGLPATIRESIDLLNIHERPIVEIEPDISYKFASLYVSAQPTYFPFDIKPGNNEYDTVWPGDVFSELRAKLIAAAEKKYGEFPSKKRRLFVSRNSFASRCLTNEQEIVSYLSLQGFEVFHPEKHSFVEQIEAFKSASVVVGVCSSALSNALFCEPGTPVIGLIHDYSGFNYYGYASYIQSGGAEMYFIQGKRDPGQTVHPFHLDFSVPLDEIKTALTQVGVEELLENEQYYIADDKEKAFSSRWKAAEQLIDVDFISRQYEAKNLPLPKGDIKALYLSGKLETGLWPHPLFDPDHYRVNSRRTVAEGRELLDYAGVGHEEGLNPSAAFDTAYYANVNADVADSGNIGLVHYVTQGIHEGRLPINLSDENLIERLEASVDRKVENPFIQMLLLIAAYYKTDTAFVQKRLESRKDLIGLRAALLNVAYIFIHECLYLRALNAFDLYMNIYGESADIWFQKASAFKRIGRIVKACDALKVAQRFDSKAEHIKKELQTLEAHLTTKVSLSPKPESSVEAPTDLLFFDSSFPDPISSFRFGEFISYVKHFDTAVVSSSNWDVRPYGGADNFFDLRQEISRKNGIGEAQIVDFDSSRPVRARSAYAVFINNAALIADRSIFDVNRFGFTLYPGGGFALNNRESDLKLKRVLTDSRCQYVVTTQIATYDYLLEKQWIDTNRIVHVFGGVVPSLLGGLPRLDNSQWLGSELNICFVAQRYSHNGWEKGYDVLVAVAKHLKGNRHVRFHVVGGYDSSVIPLDGLDNITFYGIQKPDFFPDFYRKMHVILSPNISASHKHGSGQFDGFPTTTCVEAGAYGVAMFLSDYMNFNRDATGAKIFQEGREFELITRDAEAIAEKIRYYLSAREELAQLANAGRRRLGELFSYDSQMGPRIRAVEKYLLD
ncbi:glycosyltransferase 61 family protein [Asticcacaulis sp. DXS10W]|uniref:Glycosyltransferase 61 family protein n=1 Tax=Asticcacaulis currens TaxID=2984210 RepID=A0ABT5IAB6_9CAUL|nr:glycosyltransferase 61 family protein [Asticcacaulis currens]MDC7692830.1 glycosyltransferase 61 family protein [Asticcacaulis currens]